MTPLFKKLNYKTPHPIYCINAPQSMNEELAAMQAITKVYSKITKQTIVTFVLFFVTKEIDIANAAKNLEGKIEGDAVIWFCYPKKTSKNFKSEISRDEGWQQLGYLNIEPVRGVAIDDDWSALRLRPVAYIKKMTRQTGYISEEGKKKKE